MPVFGLITPAEQKMIVTVNPNTCIDRTLVVPEIILNRTIRASRFALGMGGKAADASWILGEYGIPSLALGFSAGASGIQMEKMLRTKGVQTDFTHVDGETRMHTVVVMEDGSGQTTFAAPSLIVRPEHVVELESRYDRALEDASCVVIGGTLPIGVPDSLYLRMISKAVTKGIPVVLDASGSCLMAGMEGHPTILKPNRDELEELSGREFNTLEDVLNFCKEVRDRFGSQVVATLGSEGILAVTNEKAYRIPPLPVNIISTAGAGDGILAGLAASLSAGWPLEEGLRLGAAMAGAVCMQLATADCHKTDIERLLPLVELLPFEE